jgi:hypothetical protein
VAMFCKMKVFFIKDFVFIKLLINQHIQIHVWGEKQCCFEKHQVFSAPTIFADRWIHFEKKNHDLDWNLFCGDHFCPGCFKWAKKITGERALRRLGLLPQRAKASSNAKLFKCKLLLLWIHIWTTNLKSVHKRNAYLN